MHILCEEQQNTANTNSLITTIWYSLAPFAPVICQQYFENVFVTVKHPKMGIYFNNQLKILNVEFFFIFVITLTDTRFEVHLGEDEGR